MLVRIYQIIRHFERRMNEKFPEPMDFPVFGLLIENRVKLTVKKRGLLTLLEATVLNNHTYKSYITVNTVYRRWMS